MIARPFPIVPTASVSEIVQSVPEWLRQLALEETTRWQPLTKTPREIAEAQSFLPAVARLLEPATRQERAVALMRLLDHYPKPEVLSLGDETRIAAWWRDYHDDLADLPLWVLQAATADWRRGTEERHRWFPRPGDLLDCARRNQRLVELTKLKRGLQRIANAEPKEPGELVEFDIQAELAARRARRRQQEAEATKGAEQEQGLR